MELMRAAALQAKSKSQLVAVGAHTPTILIQSPSTLMSLLGLRPRHAVGNLVQIGQISVKTATILSTSGHSLLWEASSVFHIVWSTTSTLIVLSLVAIIQLARELVMTMNWDCHSGRVVAVVVTMRDALRLPQNYLVSNMQHLRISSPSHRPRTTLTCHATAHRLWNVPRTCSLARDTAPALGAAFAHHAASQEPRTKLPTQCLLTARGQLQAPPLSTSTLCTVAGGASLT